MVGSEDTRLQEAENYLRNEYLSILALGDVQLSKQYGVLKKKVEKSRLQRIFFGKLLGKDGAS